MAKHIRPRAICKHCGSVSLLYRSRTHDNLCKLCGGVTKKGEKGGMAELKHTSRGAMTKITKKFPDGYAYTTGAVKAKLKT